MTMAMDYSDLSILDDSQEEEEIAVNPAISVTEASDVYGKFNIGPLDPGYGVTLGNPLRRVLYNKVIKETDIIKIIIVLNILEKGLIHFSIFA